MRKLDDRFNSRFTTLLDATRRLMGLTNPEELLQVLLDATRRLFQAEACSIALIDEAEQEIAFAFTLGGAKVQEVRLPLGQGIISWVAEKGEGIISNDVSRDTRFFSEVDRKSGFKTKAVLCAPLRDRERIIGAIEVLNTETHEGFDQEDLELLTTFGELITPAIQRTKAFAILQNAQIALQEIFDERYQMIGGVSSAMQDVLRMGRSAAASHSTVLLLGESGTGKEVLARTIHHWSPRAERPFIAVNCVALTPELLESELFGHEKGAFTGAIAQKRGKFELANSGTIFLDEIGDLEPHLQAKLLRVLQEREFQRVGGEKDLHVDVRVIAATNRDLQQAMRNGAFREDLYYRLNVLPIVLPPLRDRKEDLPELIAHFIARHCRDLKRPRLEIEPSALAALTAYQWPGNVRELQNVIERLAVLSQQTPVTLADLPAEVRGHAILTRDEKDEEEILKMMQLPLMEALTAFKRFKVREALDLAHGNQTKAAEMLGLPRSNLSHMMKALGLR